MSNLQKWNFWNFRLDVSLTFYMRVPDISQGFPISLRHPVDVLIAFNFEFLCQTVLVAQRLKIQPAIFGWMMDGWESLTSLHSMGHESLHWKKLDLRKSFRRIEFFQKSVKDTRKRILYNYTKFAINGIHFEFRYCFR